jgi:hypothetical protein
LCLLGLGAAAGVAGPARGQAPAATSPAPASPDSGLTWAEAASRTLSDGVPCVLLVTSKTVPQSENLARAILGSPAIAHIKEMVQFAELRAEAEPEAIRRLQVASFPTFVALRRGPHGGLEAAGSHRGAMSAEELSGWVRGLGLLQAAGGPARPDAAVARTGHHHYAQTPSPQHYAPPVPSVKVAPPAPREVYVERPAPPVERRIVREAAPVREIVVERAAPVREIVVERAAPREVVVEREAPRNVLTRAVPVREIVVEREAPAPVREIVVEREAPAPVREIVVEREAPRERVVEREEPEIALLPPGPLDRLFGAIGEKIRRRGLPRVDVAVETQRNYRFQPVGEETRFLAPEAVHRKKKHPCGPHCPDHEPPPAPHYHPPVAPPMPGPTPQGPGY